MTTDVLVVGAGVAGISAALWLEDQGFRLNATEGHRLTWVEAAADVGGILHQVHNPLTQLITPAEHGPALVDRLRERLAARDLQPQLQTRVTALTPPGVALTDPHVQVDLDGPSGVHRLRARFVIVATGTVRRRLGLPAETSHLGRGVARSGRAERDRFRDRRVTIVGGGDAALENALLLAEVDAWVVLIHRGSSFSARLEFERAVREHPRIEVRMESEVVDVEAQEGSDWLDAVVLQSGERIATEGLLVRIGVDACYPAIPEMSLYRGFLRPQIHPRIVAVGDCVCPDFRTVPVAIGQGAAAARQAAQTLGLRGP